MKSRSAVAVIEDLDGLALTKLVGEAKVCHIRTAGRTIYGEEAEARAWDVVELGISIRHKLVTLLGGSIEADGIVDLVICRIWHLLI